jgi:hypothetical protein
MVRGANELKLPVNLAVVQFERELFRSTPDPSGRW